MENKRNNLQSRRQFMKAAAALVGTFVISDFSTANVLKNNDRDFTNLTWHLNPAYRIKEISAEEIELYTNLGNQKQLRHKFVGVEADILRGVAVSTPIPELIREVSSKYKITNALANNRVKKYLFEFKKSHLTYTGPLMIVKISEVTK